MEEEQKEHDKLPSKIVADNRTFNKK
jgi:hypothetical protein